MKRKGILPVCSNNVHLELPDQFQFVEAAIAANVLKEYFLERDHEVPSRRNHAARQRRLAQRVHHARAIDLFGTARRAGLAPHALPDRLRLQRLLPFPKLRKPHHLIRRHVHVHGHGTSRGAFAALVAIGYLNRGWEMDRQVFRRNLGKGLILHWETSIQC